MELQELTEHIRQLTTEAIKRLVAFNYGVKRAEKELHLRHGFFPFQ